MSQIPVLALVGPAKEAMEAETGFLPVTRQAFLTVALGLLLGTGMGWLLRKQYYARCNLYQVAQKKANPAEELTGIGSEESGDYIMAICCRADLNLSKGRLMSEVAHAACSCASRASSCDPDALYMWKNCGQPKKVLQARKEDELFSMADLANSLGLTATLIRGTGRDSLSLGTRSTVLGIGPGPSEVIDKVVGHLKHL